MDTAIGFNLRVWISPYLFLMELLFDLQAALYTTTCHLRDMIASSKEWAKKRGLLQRSEIHGQEEWKIPVEKSFEYENEKSQTTRTHGTMVAQDSCLSLISDNLRIWFCMFIVLYYPPIMAT